MKLSHLLEAKYVKHWDHGQLDIREVDQTRRVVIVEYIILDGKHYQFRNYSKEQDKSFMKRGAEISFYAADKIQRGAFCYKRLTEEENDDLGPLDEDEIESYIKSYNLGRKQAYKQIREFRYTLERHTTIPPPRKMNFT